MKTRLWQTAENKRGSYPVRTHHLDSEGEPRFINRLVMEDSPYLLQHAHNPVNWYAWGSEAFAAAGTQGKPVFLSIGYSTCHWCHVMEEESFDNEAIAAILNQHFISIKLDREQHPDIDEYYMTAVQFISGHGGWPMSNFMLADGKPFYSATYFPPSQFAAVLTRIAEMWRAQKSELIESAGKVSESVAQWLSAARASKELDLEHARVQTLQLLDREDRRWGGLAGAPKFPQEPLLSSLLDLARRDRNPDAAGFVFRALEAMARGGIYDQIGGGFHRYSVDAQWLVPHFEKMLYNQSQLSRLYLLAWQLTGNTFFRRITTQTLDYVLREMQLPEGGFYSATDADSDGEEGRFFIWTFSELKQLLDLDELALVQHFFDISETGNFEGANIFSLHNELYPAATADNSIASLNTNTINQLDKILLKLRNIRSLRNPPLRDDKLIVAWSAAMASSLALAGWHLENTDYTEAAQRAIENIWKCSFDSEMGLQRIYLNANTSVIAQLEDYAALCEALLVLFDISSEVELLQRAYLLADRMLSEYWNEANGGFFNNRIAVDGPTLARSSHAGDGATFSAIAMALGCLVSLHQRRALLAGKESGLEQRINRCIAAHAGQVAENPPSHGSFLSAVRDFRQGSCSSIQYAAAGRIKVTARRQSRDIEPLLTIVLTIQIEVGWHLAAETAETFLPPTVVLSPAETAWELQTVELPAPINGEFNGLFNVKIICRGYLPDHPDHVDDSLAHSVGLILTLQACSNQLCLAQERLSFRL